MTDSSQPGTHPDLTPLDEEHRAVVHERLATRCSACGCCGGTDFEVGDALYLGFLFRSEPTDAYMVALTCTNPGCHAPRTGVRLRESDFVSPSGNPVSRTRS